MKRISFLALAWSAFCFGVSAQKAVAISEFSAPFGNTTDKIIELYNASDAEENIGGCRLYVSSSTSLDCKIPNGTKIAAKSTYTIIFTTSTRWNEIKSNSTIANSTNKMVAYRTCPSGPLYFYDANGKTLDYIYSSKAQRTSIILDEYGYLAAGSGTYETSFTPTLLSTDIKTKHKKALLYEYDNAGNRVLRQMNTIYIHDGASVQLQSFVDEENNFAEMELPNEANSLSIYPNPVRGNLYIKTTGENLDYTYKVYTLTGVELLNGEITESGEENVAMDDFRSGTYILVIDNGEKRESYKIVKE